MVLYVHEYLTGLTVYKLPHNQLTESTLLCVIYITLKNRKKEREKHGVYTLVEAMPSKLLPENPATKKEDNDKRKPIYLMVASRL